MSSSSDQLPSKDQLRFSWAWDDIALNWRISMIEMGDGVFAGYDHLAGYYERRLIEEIERLREELAREVGTREARVAEIDHLRRRTAELERQLNKAEIERAWALGAFERFQVGDEVTYLGVPTKIAEIKKTYVLEGGTVVQPRMLTRRAAQPSKMQEINAKYAGRERIDDWGELSSPVDSSAQPPCACGMEPEQLEGPCPNCNQWVVLKATAKPPGDDHAG